MATTWLLATLALAGTDDEKAARPDLGPERATRVLYAGVPGTERERAFLEFLRGSFTTVGNVELAKLSADATRGYDVVVADGPRMYPMDQDSTLPSAGVSLGASFTRPIVMISAAGGQVQRHTKIDWL